MKLKELLKNVLVVKKSVELDVEVKGLHFDSREIDINDVFIAIQGTEADGNDYITNALQKGAAVIVSDHKLVESKGVLVKDARKALSIMAANLYRHPSSKMFLAGVTGTNGKTTVATLAYQMFMAMGNSSALISTVENKIEEMVYPSTHTTPDPLMLNKFLAEADSKNVRYALMEVSSHALEQERTADLDFNAAVFTNLTHDHLDYHGDFRSYIEAKQKLFTALPADSVAVINMDEKHSRVMVEQCKARIVTYGMHTGADVMGKVLQSDTTGVLMRIEGIEFHSPLIGSFNAVNLLASYALGKAAGYEPEDLLRALSMAKGAEGRMEVVFDEKHNRTGIIDYAHTPDALEKVLETVKKLQKRGDVIVVVGCGGDRDRTKRPIMGRIAARMADKVVFTSDNPRSEDPEKIISAILEGVDETKNILAIPSRREAIKTSAQLCRRGDTIVIAGKGHEKYQVINGKKLPFDDVQELRNAWGIENI